LSFIGIAIGTTIGCVVTHLVSRKYNSLIDKWRGFPPAEERLYGAMIAGPSLVIGIFVLGWAGAYPSVHWIVPEIGAVIIGMCVSLTFHSLLVRFPSVVIATEDLPRLVQTYTVDTYL
jgi:MFS transporter, DHA1 family, multidrug resistance protein